MQITSPTTYKSPLSKPKDIQGKNIKGYNVGDYIQDKLAFTRMMNERLFEFYNRKGTVSSGEMIKENENISRIRFYKRRP